ncbi:MAG: hypothetical protein J7M25_04985 [Deltaproteobacteria bacterium]|nr:hypothetical protein [Deltaproteobacteria bacterium]
MKMVTTVLLAVCLTWTMEASARPKTRSRRHANGMGRAMARRVPAMVGRHPRMIRTAGHSAIDPRVDGALRQELTRNVRGLRIAGEPAPYFLAVAWVRNTIWGLYATLGHLMSPDKTRRMARVYSAVRVGSMDRDNTNYYGHFGPALSVRAVPFEVNGLAIRRGLHLAFDSAYRRAIGYYAAKQAYLRNHPGAQKTADWTKEKGRSQSVSGAIGPFAVQGGKAAVLAASAVFRSHPKIQQSSVSLYVIKTEQLTRTSEGVRLGRVGREGHLKLRALTQATDGRNVGMSDDQRLVPGQVLDRSKAVERAKRLAELVERLAVAPKVKENYTGPVLFEDQGAGMTLLGVLGVHLSSNPPPVTWNRRSLFEKMLGRPILARSVSVIDDPGLSRYKGKMLAGHQTLDDEGIVSKRVVLVKAGRLMTFLSSRRPSVDVKRSNGHGRALTRSLSIVAAPTNLVVRVRRSLSRSGLMRRYLAAVRHAGLDHGYVVTRVRRPSLFGIGRSRGQMVTLPSPQLVYRVDLNGKRTLVRGVRLDPIQAADLKDIVLFGGPEQVHNVWLGMGRGISIRCRNFVLPRASVTPRTDHPTRLPMLPSPLTLVH